MKKHQEGEKRITSTARVAIIALSLQAEGNFKLVGQFRVLSLISEGILDTLQRAAEPVSHPPQV